MTTISVIFGSFIIIIGILYLVAPDAMWSLQRFSNSMEGQKSERSDTWELTRVLRGLFFIFGGIVFMLWGMSLD